MEGLGGLVIALHMVLSAWIGVRLARRARRQGAPEGWLALETLRDPGVQRRRPSLGLGDPVVADRFLRWGPGPWPCSP